MLLSLSPRLASKEPCTFQHPRDSRVSVRVSRIGNRDSLTGSTLRAINATVGTVVVVLASRAAQRRQRRQLKSKACKDATEGQQSQEPLSTSRRTSLALAGVCATGCSPSSVTAKSPFQKFKKGDKIGPTNEIMQVVDGIRRKRLGQEDLFVSELALGTQRWASADFNAPDEKMCHAFMDRVILGSGVNLVDTAEQYPIPSDDAHPEGLAEQVIGRWIAKEPGRRKKIVVATKITGGNNVTPENIQADCEGSLKRLGTDYIDIYQLHWPARYSPQSNWGQSLAYAYDLEESMTGAMGGTSFEELCVAMGKLHKQGKIRGWGLCNDNAFGLTACCETAKRLGVPPPVSFQGDYSILDRKSEENGVFEASSPINENVGFLAYNTLAGGMLTGKYIEKPEFAANPDRSRIAQRMTGAPRGRMDDISWGETLYRYRTPAAKRAIAKYAKLAKDSKMSLTELSLRWCRERQGCTSVLLGTSNMKQLEEDLRCFQVTEPLPAELQWEIDRVHMQNRLPLFSSDEIPQDQFGVGAIGEPIP